MKGNLIAASITKLIDKNLILGCKHLEQLVYPRSGTEQLILHWQ